MSRSKGAKQVGSTVGPWVRIDNEYFDAHPEDELFVRDLIPGEKRTFIWTNEYVALEGYDLYDALRRHVKNVPHEGASLRVAVLKIRRRRYMRVPVLDWPGRDRTKLWRIGIGGSLCEIPADSVLARCREKQQAAWE